MSELSSYFEFDDPARAIRIKRFDTPQPWINYLSNGRFHAFVSQAGGGFCWWHSPVVHRLTRYRQYHLPLDSPGFYVYIRHADGSYWSPTWRPCETPLDAWEARHAAGRSAFVAEKNGVRAELRYFVPPDIDALVWRLNLTNVGSEAQQLDAFAYVEHSQLGWGGESGWGYYVKLQLKTWYDQTSQSCNYLFHGGGPRLEELPLVFLASDRDVLSYSGSRNHFVGDYRSERNPVGVERGHCGNDTIDCGEPASALQNRVELAPGESLQLNYHLGVAPGALVDLPAAEQERDRVLAQLRSTDILAEQEEKLKTWWDAHFAVYQCELPEDPAVERQINTWNVINSVTTGRYSRSVNTAAPGIRGIGFRDSCQDMLAIAYRDPAWATRMLQFLLSQQYRDGHVVHYAYPEEKQAPNLSLRSDNHLWTPLVAHAILSETGDMSLLEAPVPYLAADHESQDGEGSLWEHLVSAARFTENNLGAHQIPLTYDSDWNDIIGRFNQHGRGETVFAGMQYLLALRYLVELAELNGKSELEWLRGCLDRQESALLACAWDGQWWRRGFDDDGNAVGSSMAEAGRLFLNPQSWAVISGLGTREQQLSGLNAAHDQLLTKMGLKLLTPSFASWGHGKAKVGYGPGTGENGAIFCHANTWAIIAEAMVGNAERAWHYFRQLIPINAMREVGIERYRAEPYAWVSNIVGPDNNRFGWANVEQITGTAPWMDVAATQYLLGLRPTPQGLRIAPCLPSTIPGFKATRRFRGTTLHIDVRNESGQGTGVKSLTLDDQRIDAPLLGSEQLDGRREGRVVVKL